MTTKDILIADTDFAFCKSLQNALKNRELEVDYICSARGALNQLLGNEYSLLIVDACLPEVIDGLGLIRVTKQIVAMPVLVLSNGLTSDEKKSIFSAGADAYMEKPVDVTVCIAQAQSLIAHYGTVRHNLRDSNSIALGADFVVCPQYRQILVNGKPLSLTRTEFDILYLFVRRPQQVFTLEQIHDHLWGDEFAVKGDDAIRAHIKRLRSKLSAVGKDCIQNVWGVGYKLIPPNTRD